MFDIWRNTRMRTKHISTIMLIILLSVGAFACGGGGNPVNDDNQGQGNNYGATLTGRILDREGTPVGDPWVTISLTTSTGSEISPAMKPSSTGPDAGKFKFIGIPLGIPVKLEIVLYHVALGRNLGWIHQMTITTGGTFDLGDIVLENDFLNLGWADYVSKNYVRALINFNRAIEERYAQTNLSYSSSAYNGIGWVYAKRGKNCASGLMYVDPDTGAWLDTINSYEWDQALLNFDKATINEKDSDALVGKAGTYLTLLGQSNKDPVILGPWIPFYCFINFYFDEAEKALNAALSVDPDYKCAHDKITADDLRAVLLFLKWIQGKTVTVQECVDLSHSPNLNQGSKQLLTVLPDLITYNPYPQL